MKVIAPSLRWLQDGKFARVTQGRIPFIWVLSSDASSSRGSRLPAPKRTIRNRISGVVGSWYPCESSA